MQTTPRAAGHLRVMTLNTWFHPPLDARIIEAAAWVDAVKPHVICLQEVETGADETQTFAHRVASQARGSWHLAVAGLPRKPGVLIGNAILSRWPIEDHAMKELTCSDSYSKSVLHAQTGTIDVFAVHLSAAADGAQAREQQVLELADFVQARSNSRSPLPPIVAGDFNATPGSSAIRFLRGEQPLAGRSVFYQDAWAVAGDGGAGHTWTRTNPNTPPAYLFDARCDYIFVGTPQVPLGWSTGDPDTEPIGQVTAATVICNTALTGVLASDHFGVTADICWPQVPATEGRPIDPSS